MLLLFGLGDYVREGELEDPSPHRVVVGIDARAVVGGKPELEARLDANVSW